MKEKMKQKVNGNQGVTLKLEAKRTLPVLSSILLLEIP